MLTAARPAHADLQADILRLLELKGPAYTDCRAKLVEDWRSAPEQHSKERETLRPVLKAVADGIEASAKWPEQYNAVETSFVDMLEALAAPFKGLGSAKGPPKDGGVRAFELSRPLLATPDNLEFRKRNLDELQSRVPPLDATYLGATGHLIALNEGTYPFLREIAVSGIRNGKFSERLAGRLLQLPFTVQSKALLLAYYWEMHTSCTHDLVFLVDLALATDIPKSELFRDCLGFWALETDDVRIALLYRDLAVRFPDLAGTVINDRKRDAHGVFQNTSEKVMDHVNEALAKDPTETARVAAELEAAKKLHIRGVSELPDTPTPSPTPTPSAPPLSPPPAPGSSASERPTILLVVSIVGALALIGTAIVLLKRRS